MGTSDAILSGNSTDSHSLAVERKRLNHLAIFIPSGIALLALVALGYLTYQTHELNQKVALLERQQVEPEFSLVTPRPQDPDAQLSSGAASQSSPPNANALVNPPLGGSLNPLEEMRRMHEEINKMFESAWSHSHQMPGFDDFFEDSTFSPSVDLNETQSAYIVKVNVPGADESNIQVSVNDSLLTITGSNDQSKKISRENGTAITQENSWGSSADLSLFLDRLMRRP